MTNSQPRVQLCRQIPHGANATLKKLPRGMGMLKLSEPLSHIFWNI